MFQNICRVTIKNVPRVCIRQFSSGSECPKFAVVLSGCGFLDGAEIHESVSVLSHLTRNKVVPHVFALNCKQYHVIDHFKGEEDASQSRNIMSEASRIARHPVKSLENLLEDINFYDGIIFPGGFGVAKNLSNFITKGSEMEVNPLVEKALQCFHSQKKPIGLICIAPILAAKLFVGVRITLGMDDPEKWPYHDTIRAATNMGAVTEMKGVDGVCADFKNMIFSTPAFMYDGEYHEVDDGIGKLVVCMLTAMTYGS